MIRSRTSRISIAAVVFSAFVLSRGFAQEAAGPFAQAIQDTFEARAAFLTRLITARWQGVVDFAQEIFKTSTGRVLVKVEKETDFFYVQFVNEKNGAFDLVTAGSCVVQRNYDKVGLILGAKIFLADDPDTYLLVYPKGERTLIDVVMYGVVVKQAIAYPALIYVFLQKPLDTTVLMTKSTFDWSSVIPSESPFATGLASFASSMADPAFRKGFFSPLRGAMDATRAISELAKNWKTAAEFLKPVSTVVSRALPDVRKADRPFEAFPAWSDGFPAWAAKMAVYDASTKDRASAYFLLAVRKDGTADRIVVVPVFSGGQLRLVAYDESGAVKLDDFIARNGEAKLRVIRFGAF